MEEMPVFVKIEDYKNIVDVLHVSQEKLQTAKALLSKIQELKEEEDAELAAWQAELDDIDERLHHVSRTLLEPEV